MLKPTLEVKYDDNCFCCGSKNENGLGMSFQKDPEGVAVSTLTIPPFCSGWTGVMHGGFTAMILDEIMAHACLAMDLHAVTAELTTRYLKPVPVGTTVTVTGRVTEVSSILVRVEGKVEDQEGNLLATGKGRFVQTKLKS